MIGLERSRYDVAEDAGSVEVCVRNQETAGIPSSGIRVEMRTAEGGKLSLYYCIE